MARKRKQQRVQDDAGFGPAPLPGDERARLTPLDVQQKVFRLAFRGYNEQDVDQFLDEVTEDLASLHEENKRLREELELRGTPAGFDDAKRHAEETVRRAREEAARITSDAERRAGLVVGGGGSAPPPGFLVRERDFLQQLAGLVQSHAETLKGEARRAREQQGAGATPPSADDDGEEGPDPEPVEVRDTDVVASEGAGDEEERVRAWSGPMEQRGGWEPSSGEAISPEEWSRATHDRLAEQRSEVPGYAGEGDEEEPSLRELFWGEE